MLQNCWNPTFRIANNISIGNIVSSLAGIKKSITQGSILGPFLFNVFIYDSFILFEKCDLYNFADDNTLSFHSPDFDKIINVLEDESKTFIGWFRFNCMQANPNKF